MFQPGDLEEEIETFAMGGASLQRNERQQATTRNGLLPEEEIENDVYDVSDSEDVDPRYKTKPQRRKQIKKSKGKRAPSANRDMLKRVVEYVELEFPEVAQVYWDYVDSYDKLNRAQRDKVEPFIGCLFLITILLDAGKVEQACKWFRRRVRPYGMKYFNDKYSTYPACKQLCKQMSGKLSMFGNALNLALEGGNYIEAMHGSESKNNPKWGCAREARIANDDLKQWLRNRRAPINEEQAFVSEQENTTHQQIEEASIEEAPIIEVPVHEEAPRPAVQLPMIPEAINRQSNIPPILEQIWAQDNYHPFEEWFRDYEYQLE